MKIEDHLRQLVAPLRMDGASAEIRREAQRRSLRRRLSAVGVVGLALALLAGSLLLPRKAGGPQSAEAALIATAHAVSGEDWVPLAENQYWFEHGLEKAQSGNGFGSHPEYYFYEVNNVGDWDALDGTGGFRREEGEDKIFLTDKDRKGWERAGSPTWSSGESESQALTRGNGGYSFGASGLTLGQLMRLPTDQQELEGIIEKAARSTDKSPAEEMWTIFGDISDAPLSPQFRSALYTVLASHVDGVSYLGSTVDPIGRTGTGIARSTGEGTEERIIFDPSTGLLLATETVATQDLPGAPQGSVIDYYIVLESKAVDKSGTPWESPLPSAPTISPTDSVS